MQMSASRQTGIQRTTELRLSSAFIFHRRLHFRCVKQMFCLRLSAVFVELLNQRTSQSQHCAQVISHVSLFCFIFHILNLTKHVQVKAREQCGFVNSSGWESRTRHLFLFSRFWKKKSFCTRFYCSKNDFTTLHSNNSIILAGCFDQEVWHSQHPPPTVFSMLHLPLCWETITCYHLTYFIYQVLTYFH